MGVQVLRVSKTSIKSWILYGPVDQALKTTCQADSVRCIPLQVDIDCGPPTDLELWVNSENIHPGEDHFEFNPAVQVFLVQDALRKHCAEQGKESADAQAFSVPVIQGVAVLTGPGCSDTPTDHLECLVAALMGL